MSKLNKKCLGKEDGYWQFPSKEKKIALLQNHLFATLNGEPFIESDQQMIQISDVFHENWNFDEEFFWSLKIDLFRSVATSDFMIHLLYAFFVSKSHKIEHHGNIQDRVSKCGRIKLALKLCYYLMTYVISITLEVETN